MSGFAPPDPPGRGPGNGRGGGPKQFGDLSRGTKSLTIIGNLGAGARRALSGNNARGDLARRQSAPAGILGRLAGTNDPLGVSGYGRTDLDPLARVPPGLGGMILGPRGIRISQPGVPPNVPAGARFDPYGPPRPRPDSGSSGPLVPDPDPTFPLPIGPSPDHLPILSFPGQGPTLPGRSNRNSNPPPVAGPTPDHELPRDNSGSK